MRVYIKERAGRRFSIPVPLALANVAISIFVIWMKKSKKVKNNAELRQLETINFVELRHSLRYLRDYRGLKIVEVKSKNGDEVTIIV
jgi:hypothetical protein